ncbi:MAG: PilC/PilY family type IV pilus protein [Polyangiales bacterium]
MSLKGSTVIAVATAAASLLGSSAAWAQVDARILRPDIMLLVDTSGSMEFRMNARDDSGDCTRDDGGNCINCSTGVPQCSSSCPTEESRNRWITALEVLTGTIQGYTCVQAPRTDPAQYDYRYQIPHHEPMSFGHRLFEPGALQASDGIVDVYADRVRFGLMTGDFEQDPRDDVSGMWSYADPHPFAPPMCATVESWNFGAKRASLDDNTSDIVPGGLVSVGDASADTSTLARINQTVQQALVGRPAFGILTAREGVRPIGSTPIAALLDDALYYWTNHADVIDGSTTGRGDPYYQCRNRANILITDGAPTDDFWRAQCRGGGLCPYDTPSEVAMRMAAVGPTSPGVRTYVIAFDQNPAVEAALSPIALAGNTPRVYYANDRPSFAGALSTILDTVASSTSTRIPPVYATSGIPSAIGTPQYQFSTAFTISPGLPWSGSLTRQRTVCESPSMGAPPVPTEKAVDTSLGDDFGYNLRAAYRATQTGWGQRYLWTYVPAAATTAAQLTTSLTNATSGTAGFARDLPALAGTPALFGYTSTPEVNTLISWLRGDAGTVREFRPLGDIYRSTPVSVQAPLIDLPDQSFTSYRGLTLSRMTASSAANAAASLRRSDVRVGSREAMMYVGSNDGVLHAFNTDNGEEVWGFVPPYLVPTLRTHYPSTRAFGVDGTPVVKDVVFERSAAAPPTAASWRTVLVVGLRNGGPAYVALDVTDPYQPRFLWQFTDPTNMVAATGTPSIGTLYFTPVDRTVPVERAVAFIPGGAGRSSLGACTATSHALPARNAILATPDSGRGTRRPYNRCWDTSTGQYLYVLDLQTGEVIRRLGAGMPVRNGNAWEDTVPTGSPLTGAPALYNGTAGAVTTRAYLGDGDGFVWRADFSSRDPRYWWMSDEYDMYWGSTYDHGQPIIERPMITVGTRGEVNVAVGSGDPEVLDDTLNEYRVASFTETTATDSSGAVTSVAVHENWQIRPGTDTTRDFQTGERMTGSMTVFNGVLYFGSFTPRSTMNPCDFGYARLWGLDMTRFDTGTIYDYPKARLDLDGDPLTASDIVRASRDLNFNGTETDDGNSVLFGVAISRRMSCNVTATAPDPITGMPRSYVSSSTGGEYRLVLQTAQAGRTGSTGLNPIVTRRLPRPQMPARVDSWAAIFE